MDEGTTVAYAQALIDATAHLQSEAKQITDENSIIQKSISP
jgi:hypothetical protein